MTNKKTNKQVLTPIAMLRGILLLLIAHDLFGWDAVFAQDPLQATLIPPNHWKLSSQSSQVMASTSKTEDAAGKSIVVNWKLTCQQLCGSGYGGPACGPACLERVNGSTENIFKISSKVEYELCPTLCGQGLGTKKCACAMETQANGSFQDRNEVCSMFCAVAKFQLNGCSRCGGDQLSDPATDSGVQTTTPNWDELCSVWCKMGEGGTLCNCDLPPFI
ncbi:uncharacterized protein LOC129722709 isoform X2 [Wyeomyia smithii]|uniref:uncharacterized protein LOC129722709 isoform X2 n=1 Tax=Wyeomyia smithii TaxID=174621 RepID=UPI002467CDFD|nr:uncharacterized protein LOC129722709 isoform X2 [Wyeomyia smithii]